MFKYYNHRLVKKYRSYTAEEICKLFQNRKLHVQTIRDWVRSGELEVITKNPITIYGEVLRAFLEKRNAGHKKQLAFNQLKCLKCQEIISPHENAISIYNNQNGSITASAICPVCHNKATRFYKKDQQAQLEKTFIINEPLLVTIGNSSSTACKTHLDNVANNSLNEPSVVMEDA
jgi:hypothetical protein